MEKIDEANNQCLFLLNASLLASIYALLCLVISAYNGVRLRLGINPIGLEFISGEMSILHIVLGILAGLTAWFFYIASLFNVNQFGSMIRVAYDLYRFNLIEALHLKLPTTLREEKQLWKRVGYFMIGNDQWERMELEEIVEKYSEAPDAGFRYRHGKK